MALTQRQHQIIDTALALIAEKGIQNLTIRNISDRVGVSEPAVYRHFENKSEIIMTLLDRFEQGGNEVLTEMSTRKGSALQKIEYFIFDRYNRCIENPDLAKVMFSEEHFQGDPRFSERMLGVMRRHREIIHNILAEGQRTGEIRKDISTMTVFRTVFGSVRLLVKQWCLSGFSFELISEGKTLWTEQKKILKSPDTVGI